MIFFKKKDKNNRFLYNKNEINKKIKKFLFIYLLNSKKYNNKQKSKFLYLFFKKQIKNKTKITFRCILTNRSRGNYRLFNISRLALREMIHLGIMPGYTKAVW
jgi:small subunit ribosomal protein S14